ncbi:MAG: winged helix-turn-helix domain-containing protein [Peptoniphilaceae bacterium]
MINSIRPELKVMIVKESKFFGPGVYKLLKLIDETLSIKLACKKMGLSYSKGRKLIKKMEEELNAPIVISKAGGNKGGESSLTELGKIFLNKYERYVMEVEKFSKEKFNEIYSEEVK